MTRFPRLVVAGALGLLLAGCAAAPQPEATAGYASRPELVLVRPFAVPPGVVALDPNFGFSLRRGAPGVPAELRAATVGRAAGFVLSDAVVEALRAAGFDAVRAPEATASPPSPALIVDGSFEAVDEGVHSRGRRSSRVAAEARIDYQVPGSPPRRLLTMHADSSQLPARAGAAAPDLDADAAAVGRAVAQAVLDFARRAGWLAKPR